MAEHDIMRVSIIGTGGDHLDIRCEIDDDYKEIVSAIFATELSHDPELYMLFAQAYKSIFIDERTDN